MKPLHHDHAKYQPLLDSILLKARADARVLAVVLFGSYARADTFRDIDVCLFISRPVDANAVLLEYTRGFPEIVDFSIFSQLPLYVRAGVLKEGTILLDNNYDDLFEIYWTTIKEYQLFEPHWHTYLEAVRDG